MNIFTRFSTYTILVALAISVVAEYYSIVGLTTIFAGAVIPTIIMGVVLGLGKITATVWLKLNWYRASFTYKMYLIPAIVTLMFLTSIGIFGYLSAAHSEQSVRTGDAAARIEVYDTQIATLKSNIESDRATLVQMDTAVEQSLARTTDARGVNRSVSIRRSQLAERERLNKSITESQQQIADLNAKRAPLAAEGRRLEAELGPLKYIAAIVYGDNPDKNLVESAVRWVIIIIVVVFDPLALILLLAGQQSRRWEDAERLSVTQVNDVVEKPPLVESQVDRIEEANEKLDLIPREYDEFVPPLDEPTRISVESDPSVECVRCGTELVDSEHLGRFCPAYGCGLPQDIEVESPEPDEQQLTESDIDHSDVVSSSDFLPAKIAPPPAHHHHVATEGITAEKVMYPPNSGYITFEGKRMSVENLKSIRPDLIIPPDGIIKNAVEYGTEFPKLSLAGDTYVRVDVLPHRVYKFDGKKWMSVDTTINTTYLTNTNYVKYLIGKLENGEYDPESLTYAEQDAIEDYLISKRKK